MTPNATALNFPPEYGAPKTKLEWSEVSAKVREAPMYWMSSVRPDGRPHLVPRDGLWVDDRLWYGGSPATVHNRNVAENRSVSFGIGEGLQAVIVEGVVDHLKVDGDLATLIAEESFRKYPQYGKQDPEGYSTGGVWRITPRRVMAWFNFPTDATRFTFGDDSDG